MLRTDGPSDIVGQIESDHEAIARLVDEVGSAEGQRRTQLFRQLVTLLVAHEVAEEEVVFPVVRKQSDELDAEAEACIAEQSEAERRLDKMERLGPDTVEFSDEFELLRDELKLHAGHEERSIVPALSRLAEGDRAMLASRFARARATAPTHPHPGAPDRPPGDLILGPVAALADRVRDAIRRHGEGGDQS